MSTVKTFQIKSLALEDTLKLARHLGKKSKGGEVFVLASDLGGGKTSFTKGLAEGLGSKDDVSSPTFTISNIYDCRDGIELHHFDFYRINEGGVVAQELSEIANDSSIVVVVEWGDIVMDVLPEDRVQITFDRSSEGEDVRLIKIEYPDKLNYLVEAIEK